MAEKWDFTLTVNNGEKWTEMDELDVADGEGVCDEDGEESQLPDDLANCFNVTIQTTHYSRTTCTAVPSKFKTTNIDNVYARMNQQLYYKTVT